MAPVASRGLGLARPGWRANLDVWNTVLRARLKIITRYKGAIFMEALLPIVFAALPILLGVSVAQAAGGDPAENFFYNTGTRNYQLYMLVGASTFMVVSLMLWLIGYWVRREQEWGTLEALYLSPAKRIYVLAGVTTYAMIRSLIAFVIAIALGSVVFGVNPLEGLAMATLFLAIGLLPMWGISFLFGAFILKVKEANSVVQVMQWVVAFFMGVYFPVTMFPPAIALIAMVFPPTVMTDGMRASLLNLDTLYGNGSLYANLAILFAMAFAVPYLGYEVFLRMERRLKKREGVGTF